MTRYSAFFNTHVFSDPNESIAALAFSPTGDLLASGGDDGNVIIWDPLKGLLLHRIIMPSAVVCMTWNTDTIRGRLFVGCLDGGLIVIEHLSSKEPTNNLVMSGTKAPIFAVATLQTTGQIAFAVGSEIHLAKELDKEKYATFSILPAPEALPNSSNQVDQRIRGRSLSFMENGRQLIVAYLNHGVVCWDLRNRTRLWRIVPIHRHGMIGYAALSPDERSIAISNLSNGADIYSPGQSHPRLRLKYAIPSDVTKNVPLQVRFVDGDGARGMYAICASAEGAVSIWDITDGQQMQVLDHQGYMVQAVATFNLPRFTLIATATSQTAENTTVRVWKAGRSIQLSTLMRYIELCCVKLMYKLSSTISDETRIFLYRLSSILPVAVLFPIFCQYLLGMDIPNVVSEEVVNLLIHIQLVTIKTLQIAVEWWNNYLHSAGIYLRHKALVLIGYLYEQLQGAGIHEDPLPRNDDTIIYL